jgi:uncharacterized protein (TIGR00369 family)
MTSENHYRNLENMYLAAPINKFYLPSIEVREKESTISIAVDEKLFHSARGVHGSVYFKMLDDAAFFAVNSLEKKVFVLTTSFTIKLTRPVSSGRLESIGKIVKMEEGRWFAESILYNNGLEVGFGQGTFVRGKTKLTDAMGY